MRTYCGQDFTAQIRYDNGTATVRIFRLLDGGMRLGPETQRWETISRGALERARQAVDHADMCNVDRPLNQR